MAFTAFRTWVTGEVVQASQMNEQIRDNGNYFKDELDKSMVRLDTATLDSDGTFSFTSIAATYASLKLVGFLRSDRNSANVDTILIQFNSDVGDNYTSLVVAIDHNAALVTAENLATDAGRTGYAPSCDNVANTFSVTEILVPNYASSDYNKAWKFESFCPEDSTTVLRSASGGGYWASTTPITAVKVFPGVGTNFKVGSRVEIYGIN